MHQTQFSEKIPYGGFSQILTHIVIHAYGMGHGNGNDVMQQGCSDEVSISL